MEKLKSKPTPLDVMVNAKIELYKAEVLQLIEDMPEDVNFGVAMGIDRGELSKLVENIDLDEL